MPSAVAIDNLPVEVSRLALWLYRPHDVVERRVESIEFVDESTFKIEVRLSVRLPSFESDQGQNVRSARYVSLGIFSKTRLPELEVYGEDGSRLAPLSRTARSRILADIFAHRYLDTLKRLIDQVGGCTNQQWSDFADGFLFLAESVIASSVEVARHCADELIGYVGDRTALPDVICDFFESGNWSDELRDSLESLVATTQLIVEADVPLEQTCEVRFFYYGRLRPGVLPDAAQTPSTHGAVRKWIGSMVIRLLAWLALYPRCYIRSAQNADHSHSYHLIVHSPPGLEVVRHYWDTVSVRSVLPQALVSSDSDEVVKAHKRERVATSGSAFSSHLSGCSGGQYTAIELALSRLAGTRLAAGLSILIAAIIFASTSQPEHFVGRADALALVGAAPAVLFAVTDGRVSQFAKSISQGAHLAMVLVAALSAVFGVCLAFSDPANGSDVQLHVPVVVLGATCFALASFLAVCLGWSGLKPRYGQASSGPHADYAELRAYQLRDIRISALVLLLAVAVSVALTAWLVASSL